MNNRTEILDLRTALKTPAGEVLMLNADGEGSFRDYVTGILEAGAAHDTAGLEQAPEELVRLMNPMDQLQVPGNVSAAHVRIRHGSHDPHTSWAIPTLLAETMRSRGIDVDYALEWGKPHSGDYDLRELFDWIEKICCGTLINLIFLQMIRQSESVRYVPVTHGW